MEYKEYLRTDHWQNKRKEKLFQRSFCQICFAIIGLNVHHKKYKDKENNVLFFRERIEDLVTLCKSCHKLLHWYFGINIKKLNKKICRIRRLIELGITKKMAFYLASQDQLYEVVYNKINKKRSIPGGAWS